MPLAGRSWGSVLVSLGRTCAVVPPGSAPQRGAEALWEPGTLWEPARRGQLAHEARLWVPPFQAPSLSLVHVTAWLVAGDPWASLMRAPPHSAQSSQPFLSSPGHHWGN